MRQIQKIKLQQGEVIAEAKGHSPTFFHNKNASVEIEFRDALKLGPKQEAFAKVHQPSVSRAQLGVEPEIEEIPVKKWYQCC